MNDFKKGLLVGMLIIVSCVSFMAKTEKSNDVGRFLFTESKLDHRIIMLVDTKNGNTYHPNYISKNRTEWELLCTMPNVSE